VLPEDEAPGADFLFRTCPSDALQGVIMGKLGADLGYKTASTLYVNNPYGQGLTEQFKKSFEYRGGKVLEMVPHPEEPKPTYVPELEKALAGKPDVLAAISYPGHATIYLKEAIDVFHYKSFLFCDGTKSLLIPQAVGPENVEGMQGTAAGSALTRSYEIFIAEYVKEYGVLPPLPYITTAYDAIAVIGLAACAGIYCGAKEVTGTVIRDNLRNVANPPGDVIEVAGFKKFLEAAKGCVDGCVDGSKASKGAFNYEGAAGSVDFDEHGDVVTPIEIWAYKGGTIVTVSLIYEVPPI